MKKNPSTVDSDKIGTEKSGLRCIFADSNTTQCLSRD